MVSIVTPVYNAAPYIAETIRMVNAQTYRDFEMLLVDDGSKDGSARVIEETLMALPEEDRKRFVLLSQKNAGAAAARNAGTRRAAGRYLCFLDADDVWVKEKLEKTLDFLLAESAAFVYHSYEFGDSKAQGTGRIVHAKKTLTYREALTRTIIFTSTVMFDREKIPEDLLLMPLVESEDTATWWRILRSGITAFGLDENLTVYRRPPSSLSSNKLAAVRRIVNLYRRQEQLSLPRTLYCTALWGIRAAMRRI